MPPSGDLCSPTHFFNVSPKTQYPPPPFLFPFSLSLFPATLSQAPPHRLAILARERSAEPQNHVS